MIAGGAAAVGVAWLLLAATPNPDAVLAVRGGTSCPTAAEVSAALVGLVAPARPSDPPDVVELGGQGPSISIRLRSAGKDVVAERLLPESPSCEERARTAAVIVAAWEARLRAGAPPMWPLPAPAAAPAPASHIEPPPAPSAARVVTARPEAPPRAPMQVATAGAVFASVAAGGIAPAAMLEAKLTRPGSPFALGVGGLAVGTHTMTVASGRGTWRRLGGVIDLESRTSISIVELQLHAALALSAVSILGESFPTTAGATIFDPGALAGLRLCYRGERLSPWLEAGAAYWPRTHALMVAGSTASANLPAAEALLGVGLSFGENR